MADAGIVVGCSRFVSTSVRRRGCPSRRGSRRRLRRRGLRGCRARRQRREAGEVAARLRDPHAGSRPPCRGRPGASGRGSAPPAPRDREGRRARPRRHPRRPARAAPRVRGTPRPDRSTPPASSQWSFEARATMDTSPAAMATAIAAAEPPPAPVLRRRACPGSRAAARRGGHRPCRRLLSSTTGRGARERLRPAPDSSRSRRASSAVSRSAISASRNA